MTVYENLVLCANIKNSNKNFIENRKKNKNQNLEEELDEMLHVLDLYHKKHYPANSLSGG